MRILKVTRDSIDRLYDDFSHIEEYQGNNGYQFFSKALYDALLIMEFDWGLIRIEKGGEDSMRAHGLFKNKGVHRAIDDFQRGADFIMDTFAVDEVEVFVPSEKESLNRLLKKSCFRFKKTLRESLYDGIMYRDGNLYCYGR